MNSKSSVAQAMQWISERLKENPQSDRAKLIDDASMKFNLNPAEGEVLLKTYLKY